VYSEVVPDSRQRPGGRVEGRATRRRRDNDPPGAALGRAESAIYDCRVWRVQMYSEVVPDGRQRPGGRVEGRATGRGRDNDPPGAAPGRAASAVYDSRVWRVYCSSVL